jgi:hypothetical protein
MKAKFEIRDLLPIALTIVVASIGMAYGLQVMGDIKSDMTTGSYEQNATTAGIIAVAKFPNKMGMIVTVIIAAINQERLASPCVVS